jgi:hypothetical protein
MAADIRCDRLAAAQRATHSLAGASEGRLIEVIEAEAYTSAELLWFDLPIPGAMARKTNERHRTTTLKP